MKVATEYLWFTTKRRKEYVHITPEVEAIVQRSGVREGMVLVSAMHITCCVAQLPSILEVTEGNRG